MPLKVGLERAEFIFLIIFIVEMVLKVPALGLSAYFGEGCESIHTTCSRGGIDSQKAGIVQEGQNQRKGGWPSNFSFWLFPAL